MATFLKSVPTGPSLREIYTRPLAYGTPPTSAKWSPDGTYLAFLWNDHGEPLLDLWVYDGAETRRVTDATSVTSLPVEDDERPEGEVSYAEEMATGVGEFEWLGSILVYTVRGNLFRVPPTGGTAHRVTRSTQGWSNLKAAPDEKRLGFLASGNVWVYDTGDGSIAQLTFFSRDQVAVGSYQWSPDGKWISVEVEDCSMYEKVRMPDYSPENEVKIVELRRNNVGKPLSKIRVGFVPANGGRMQRIALGEPAKPGPDGNDPKIDTGNDIRLGGTCWTRDGSRLIVAYADKDYSDYRIVAVEPGAEARPLEIFHEVQKPWCDYPSLQSSPDSRHVYFASYRSGWRRVYRMPVGGGEPEAVTPDGLDVTSYSVPESGARLIYMANAPVPTEQQVFEVPLAGGKPERLSHGFLAGEGIVSDDGQRLALVQSSVMVPPELFVQPVSASTTNQGGPSLVRITSSPLPIFDRIRKPKLERMTFTNKGDGKTIHAKLILPADFDPAKRYPVVLTCVYAGQGKEGWGRYQPLDAYMANEMGYILVGVDLRASMGYGKDFFYGYHKSLGIVDAQECASCAEHLQMLPYVDGDRIGMWGGSYGGFLTLMAMCNHPGVFHTGVSWKPVTDWRNYWDSYTCPRLGRPEDDPEIYKATSPVFHANRLQGNLLIIHGMLDDNVLFQDAAWMIQKLIEARKYFDLMIYPRDDHGLTLRHESLPDCMERVAAYFEEHMGLGPVYR